MEGKTLLIALLGIAVCGAPVTEEVKAACTNENLEAVYALAAHHDLAHLVGVALGKMNIPLGEGGKKCKDAAMAAFARHMQQNYAFEQTCAVLEDAKIPFIPLKGSVLRAYYPEPWLRNSCDIDILVREEDLNSAIQVLTEKLSCTHEGKTSHDVGLLVLGSVHLELHYSTIEDYVSPDAQQILSDIWNVAKPAQEKTYCLEMPDALFYFYHIAHMAKHFLYGGCGIRPFLDLWIMDEKMPCDPKARQELLERGNLLTFARGVHKLSRVWFSGEDWDAVAEQTEQFVLKGGTYGTLETYVTVNQAQKGSKLRYMLSRVFLPYDVIKHYYPVLQKNKWLTPVYQVMRWFRIAFCGRADRAIRELQTNAATSATSINTTAQLFKQLGL